MEENIFNRKSEIFLYKWRLIVNIITILVGIIINLYIMFIPYNINILILGRSCGALLILTGLWHIKFVNIVPLASSIASWALTWFAYFLAYDDLVLRIWSYIFIAIGSFHLICWLMELVNRQLEKEFGKSKKANITEHSLEKGKSTLYITVSSVIFVLIFIGIIWYYSISSYRSIK
ncbi:MAG TPA: hypothetical protein DEQ64_14465 [Lachnoclostridium sp.]|uniref:hypothetical protein n=1 Tax=Lacrimispora sp. TaxID=2719234 RepID=UPI000ECA6A2D|nr:hypothetical protein [Lacrimispora sp.]HCD44903.1 hypothetical protein [Lachnoclostridium sp.]